MPMSASGRWRRVRSATWRGSACTASTICSSAAIAPTVLAQTRDAAQDLDPTASRVYPGPSGTLVHVPDEQGNTIHDASHAGYCGGGVAIPTVPVRETVWPVAGDDTQSIQAAIDRVSARTPDATRFRGAVLMRAGYYRMGTPVRIQASGVVLRLRGELPRAEAADGAELFIRPYGVNAVVFNIPLQDTSKENGHLESLDRHVSPRSLYLTQLHERLGEAAVRRIATASQLA